jgi:hypothetical protein
MIFKNFDKVKWSRHPGVWTVVQERVEENGLRRYRIQLGSDAARQEWALEDELELVERPKST